MTSFMSTQAANRPATRLRSFTRRAARLLPSPRTTPLATAMVTLLVLAGVWLHTHPADIDDVAAWASTNIHNLAHHPVAAMVASAFVVPRGLLPQLIVVALGFAVLERAIGAWRTAVVALSGQVFATLLTEYGADLGAHLHLLADSAPDRLDVGVSYVMYAVLTAAALRMTGVTRIVSVLGIGASVLVPFAIVPGMTTTGHLLSVAIGAVAVALLTRRDRPAGSGTPSRSRAVTD
jgi:hypothetical protein